MSNELPSGGKSGQIDRTNYSQWEENLRKKGQQMKEVRDAAIALATKHPDKFSVLPNKNEWLTSITAVTEGEIRLKEGKERVTISLSVTSWNNGRLENCVNIRPVGKDKWDNGAISYRLDVVQGDDTEDLHKRMSEVQDSDADVNEGFRQVLSGMRDSMFEVSGDGELASLSDNYAETTIKTEGALWVIKNAKRLQRPKEWGYVRGISLREFQDYLKQQDSRGESADTPKLLGR